MNLSQHEISNQLRWANMMNQTGESLDNQQDVLPKVIAVRKCLGWVYNNNLKKTFKRKKFYSFAAKIFQWKLKKKY